MCEERLLRSPWGVLGAGRTADGVWNPLPSGAEKELARAGCVCLDLNLPEYLEIPRDRWAAPAPPRLRQIGAGEMREAGWQAGTEIRWAERKRGHPSCCRDIPVVSVDYFKTR